MCFYLCFIFNDIILPRFLAFQGRVVQYVNFGKSNCGGVEVDWSGTLSKHKLGVDGKAELIMEEPFQLGTIYADHLPLGGKRREREREMLA